MSRWALPTRRATGQRACTGAASAEDLDRRYDHRLRRRVQPDRPPRARRSRGSSVPTGRCAGGSRRRGQ
jgi:hypothetical protein